MKTLLGIFSPGAVGATIGLTAVFGLIITIFLYQVFKAAKSGSVQQSPKGTIETLQNMGPSQQAMFWMAVVTFIIYIACMIGHGISYRPVNHDKYKVKPLDDGRIPAQDLIPK